MSERYEPELGQAVFGQPFKEFGCDSYIEAALAMIREELDRVMWNIHQKEYSNPFNNTGAQFDCPTFSARSYSWGDDEQPWNFKWRDVEISWYKYLGRGMSANQRISPDLAAEMLRDCLDACQRYETEHEAKP